MLQFGMQLKSILLVDNLWFCKTLSVICVIYMSCSVRILVKEHFVRHIQTGTNKHIHIHNFLVCIVLFESGMYRLKGFIVMAADGMQLAGYSQAAQVADRQRV